MKRRAIGFIFLGFLAWLQVAAAQPIAYQRVLPTSVARLTPKKAKRYFWGTFRLRTNGPLYGIHLLKTNPALIKKESGIQQTQHFVLDTFIRTDGRFKRIQRVPIRYKPAINPPDLVKVESLWINKEKTMPLVKLKIFTEYIDLDAGCNGFEGTEVSIAFPKGINKKAYVQTWGELLNQKNDWTTRGTGGLLRVVTYKELEAQPRKKTRRTTWTWKEQGFRIANTKLIYEKPIEAEEVKPGSQTDKDVKAILDYLKRQREANP